MFLNISKLSIASLALISVSTFASVTTADFGSVVDTGKFFDSFSVASGGVTIEVSSWSDTATFNSTYKNPLTGNGSDASTSDDRITTARDMDIYKGGWSIQNKDEAYGINNANAGLDNKQADGYSHSSDNLGSSSIDYDMFMLEFSEAVNLSQATYSWVYGSGSDKSVRAAQNQVTVAALSDNNIRNQSWESVSQFQTIESDYSQVQYSSGYFTNFTTSDVNSTFSKYWLIGALNTVFGGDINQEGDDGMKLASVSFTKQGTPPPSVSVPEPSSIMMFGLALFGFAATRRKVK